MNDQLKKGSQDLRIIKTEYAIKKTFLQLLKKKPYSKISVTEIVEKAQINRNTFYLHYIDKEDLLSNIVKDEFGKYDKAINKIIENYLILPDITEENLNYAFIVLLNDLNKDIDFYRLILKDKDMRVYALKIKDYVRTKFENIIDYKDKKKRMSMEFCFEGAFGLLMKWVEYGNDLAPINYITFAMSKIIFETFKNIKKSKKVN